MLSKLIVYMLVVVIVFFTVTLLRCIRQWLAAYNRLSNYLNHYRGSFDSPMFQNALADMATARQDVVICSWLTIAFSVVLFLVLLLH